MLTENNNTLAPFPGLRSVVSVLTVCWYILFSAIKRFGESEQLYWIPVVLFLCNFCIVAEAAYLHYKRHTKKPAVLLRYWGVLALANTGLLLLSGSYIIYP